MNELQPREIFCRLARNSLFFQTGYAYDQFCIYGNLLYGLQWLLLFYPFVISSIMKFVSCKGPYSATATTDATEMTTRN